MSRRPGHLLQVARAREEFIDYLRRWEFEIVAESTPRVLKLAGMAATLLLEKMVRIQGHETLETREYEMKLEALRIRSERMWQPEQPGLSKAGPRLRLVQ